MGSSVAYVNWLGVGFADFFGRTDGVCNKGGVEVWISMMSVSMDWGSVRRTIIECILVRENTRYIFRKQNIYIICYESYPPALLHCNDTTLIGLQKRVSISLNLQEIALGITMSSWGKARGSQTK